MTTPNGVLFSDPQVKPLSTIGLPQAGAYLLFFLTGTTTPANVYADGLLATPLSQTPGAAQPSCTADSAGRFNPIYLNPATIYRVQLFSALNVKLEDTDPYVPPGVTSFTQASIGAILYPRTAAEISAGVTPANFAYPTGDARRYGCVLDGVTDDTTAMQLAVRFCIFANLSLLVNGTCLLTSAIALDRLHDSAAYDDYFIIQSTNGGGFLVNTNISMFTTSTSGSGVFPGSGAFSTAPVSQLTYFDGLNFTTGTAASGTVLQDGRFLRMRFHGCTFDKINCCVSTIAFSQSIQFTNCNMRRGSGPFWTSGGTVGYFSTDFHFNNNIVEAWTGDFLHLGLPIGCSISDNLMEGISGTAVLLNGSQGCMISGNYFEQNGLDVDMTFAGSPAFSPQGMAFIGNRSAAASSTTYSVIWGTTGSGTTLAGCVSGGNYSGGFLHSLPLNSHLAINGDFATGSLYNNPPVTDRASTPWTPSDGSGAGNVFASAVGSYRIPGNGGFVEFELEVTYPGSVSGGATAASITGLPIVAAAISGLTDVINASTSFTTYTSYIQGLGVAGSATVQLFALNTAITNTQMAGKVLRMFGRYPAAI